MRMSSRLPHTPLLRKLIGVIRRGSDSQADGMSRRQFIALSAAGLTTALVSGCGGGLLVAREQDEPIAVIGAGAAGLTAAFRLSQAGAKVALFEGNNRVGGRMLTKDNFIAAESNGGKPMFCELGGELVDSDQKDLIDLAAELGVGIQEIKGGDAGVEYYFFGGKIRTDKDLIPDFLPLAQQLARDADKLTDEQKKFTAKARRFDYMSLEKYLQSFDGKVAPWVLKLLDVAYVIENGRATREQSALNLITYLSPDTTDGFKMYGDSDESKRIQGGSSRLIEALLERIAGKVTIHMQHRLTAITIASNKNLTLTFATPDGGKEFTFAQTICALPFTMLRNGRVAGIDQIGLTHEKLRAIQELGYGNNTKAMLAFKSRLWRKASPSNNGSNYSDQSFQNCWETSRGQDGPRGILTDYLGGETAVEATPEKRFDTTLDELDKIFPGIKADYAGKRIMIHWPTQEFVQASYSCPLVGQFTTLLEHCGTPELDGRLLFAGEHTSIDFAGFMCGAIQSGNRAAKEALGRI